MALCLALVVGCGQSLGDAKKLGFESVEEMNKGISRGFKTGKEFAEAIKNATSLGFDSVDEMLALNAKGFKTKNEFKIAEEKRIEAEKIAEDQRRDRAEIASFGDKCSGGLKTNIWSFASNNGRISNAQLIIGTTISALNMDGFELDDKDLLSGKNKIIMAGIASFQGKDIPACVEKVDLKFINRSRGEKKTECFIQAYQDDDEFKMLRGVSVFECGEMQTKINEWVDSKNIRKLTNYEREF